MKIKNSNIFLLPGRKNVLHLATISKGIQEFIVLLFLDGLSPGKVYIEEVVLNTSSITEDISVNLKYIADDSLAYDLAKFAEENKITDMRVVSEHIKFLMK